jgi:hypothetical protein
MFAFTGLSAEIVDRLLADYHIYLTRDGRMSIAGLKGTVTATCFTRYGAVRAEVYTSMCADPFSPLPPGADIEYVAAAIKECLEKTE